MHGVSMWFRGFDVVSMCRILFIRKLTPMPGKQRTSKPVRPAKPAKPAKPKHTKAPKNVSKEEQEVRKWQQENAERSRTQNRAHMQRAKEHAQKTTERLAKK